MTGGPPVNTVPLLEALGVGKRYDARWVLEGLDLAVAAGSGWRSWALPAAARPPS